MNVIYVYIYIIVVCYFRITRMDDVPSALDSWFLYTNDNLTYKVIYIYCKISNYMHVTLNKDLSKSQWRLSLLVLGFLYKLFMFLPRKWVLLVSLGILWVRTHSNSYVSTHTITESHTISRNETHEIGNPVRHNTCLGRTNTREE